MIFADTKVHVEYRWGTEHQDLYVYQHLGGNRARWLQIVGHDQYEWVDTEDGSQIKPSLSLPTGVLKAIVDAASETLPPSNQMAEHLKDAREVRDRLLALVERSPASA